MEFRKTREFSFLDEDLIKNYSVVFVRKDYPEIDSYYTVSLEVLIDVIRKQLIKEKKAKEDNK